MATLDAATARKRLHDEIKAEEPTLSSTKTGKLGGVTRLFAELTGLPPSAISPVWVSKPGFMASRAGQAGAARSKLAVAVTKGADRKDGESDAEHAKRVAKMDASYVRTLRQVVGNRVVDAAVVVAKGVDGRWNVVAVVQPQPDQLGATLHRYFPTADVVGIATELQPDSQGGIPPTADGDGDLAETLFVDQDWIQEVLWMLNDKRSLVLYGPPGTGKTYLAQRIAAHMQADASHRALVQFHPSYGYEDFFEGYRPAVEDGVATLVKQDGPLRQLAKLAEANPTRPVVLVLDEMNRGNLPRIFGELFFLLEYRDETARLMYSPDERFRLPKNLFIIGTMNTADRSIALLDQALRRRFHFAGLFPGERPVDGMLRGFLREHRPEMLWVADMLDEANRIIGDRNVAIGPSFFMRTDLDEKVLRHVWRASVLPSIEEHFFGQQDRVREFDLDALKAKLAEGPRGTPTDGA